MQKIRIIVIFYILGMICLSINSKDYIIEFNGKDDSYLTINNTNETSQISINVIDISSYTKLYVDGNEDINYVISVFSDSKRETRIQLSQSSYKKTILYLTKEQADSKIIFADIECSSIPCSYNFIVSAHEKIDLEEGEQLNYYVTEKNTKMDFEINLKSDKANIWSKGGSIISNNLSNFLEKSKNGNYFLVNGKKAEFTVTGTKGDIINVGSLGFNEEKSDKKVMVDEEIINVFLSKKKFPKTCFRFGMREVPENRSLVFLEGQIENNIIYSIKNKDGEENNEEEIFTYGRIFKRLNSKDLNQIELCFTFPEDGKYSQFKNLEEIIFNFYLTFGKTSKKGQNFYEPQINGKFYLRNILSGSIAFFVGMKPEKDFEEINYNVFAESGFSNLFFYECDNYPLCNYKKENIRSNPRNIDRFSTYSLYVDRDELKNFNPINKKQNLLMVYCVPNTQVFDFFCQFDTLIYSNKDMINTQENQYFNQYLLENEIDNYKISFYKESNILKVNINIIIYVGDVETITNNLDENEYIKQHSSNKYVISIILGQKSENIDDIIFKVKAIKNSFYTIVISYVRNEDTYEITDKLQSGMNYLVTIDPLTKIKEINANKIIKFTNDKISELLPFLINFYSLNCKLEIYKKIKIDEKEEYEYAPINKFDYYHEDILSIEQDIYFEDEYEYKIEVLEEDYSSYNGKLCMAYVSSIEINRAHLVISRDIIIPDNIPQQIAFNKNKLYHISYAYIHVDNNDDIIVKFNLIHKAQYFVKFYFEYSEGKNFTINSNNIIYLNHSEWKDECNEKDQLCYIIVDITLEETKIVNEPILELSIKSVNSDTAIYIPKNFVKMDYVQNKVFQHYYTEVGKNEVGFVLVNFNRYSGRFFAKLVKKNIDYVEKDADWAGKYKFPTTTEESLKYDSYTNKIKFDTKSMDCDNGCYLLISIESNVESSSLIQQFMNYPFSIIVKSSLDGMSSIDIPPIRISFDDYIVGDIKESTDENINEFYTIWINDEAEEINIDFLSKAGGLFINVGSTKPTIKNANFKFSPSGEDSIYTIKKKEIVDILKKDSIKDTFLTLGIWANMNDTVDTTFYSFIIHLNSNSKNKIYRVKSDRKTLCDTDNIGNDKYSYRCLFVIEYISIGKLNNLLIYPTLEDTSAGYKIYAEYISPSKFEMGNETEIEKAIPTKLSEFSTDKTKLNYLYIENGLINGNYLFISVVSNKNTRIELLTTFYNYIDIITPSPITTQLFLVKKNNSLTLNFPTDYQFIVNLNSITGNAEVFWGNDPNDKFYLIQQDHKYSLTSLNNNGRLFIKSRNEYPNNDIGFAFHLTYNMRYQKNFDELIFGKSVNFAYFESDFPLAIYSRIKDINKDVEIFFTIYEIENDEKTVYQAPIKANAILVKEKTIYDIKSNSEMTIDLSKAIKFIYDSQLRTGFVRIKKEDLQKFNINKNDNPNLYIKIEKTNDNQKFKKLNLVLTAHQEDLLVPISERIYQYGILLENEDKKEYILKTMLKYSYMVVEFSSTNDELLIKMEKENGEAVNKKIEKNENGKKILFFEVDPENNEIIKLIVSKNKQSKNIYHFSFKYQNSIDIKSYKEYIIDDNNLSIENTNSNNENNYKITLNPVKGSENYNINYLVKLIHKNKKIQKESISLEEEEGERLIIREFNNPKPENGKLIFELNNISFIPNCVKVIAQVYDNGINEFLSYKNYEFTMAQNETKNSFVIPFIIVSVILGLVIISMIIVLFLCHKKNKNLYNEINKVNKNEGLMELNERNDI